MQEAEKDKYQRIVIKIDPVSAPRQVRSDAWRKRPAVLRYRSFKDELNLLLANDEARRVLTKVRERGVIDLSFELPMFDTWSKKKKARMETTPHQQKPDIDNLVKAFLDAVFSEDSFVWAIRASKKWSHVGRISFGV